MRIYNITQEKINEYIKSHKELVKELTLFMIKTIDELWLEEIEVFMKAYSPKKEIKIKDLF